MDILDRFNVMVCHTASSPLSVQFCDLLLWVFGFFFFFFFKYKKKKIIFNSLGFISFGYFVLDFFHFEK
jgi:hypothetical protein